MIFLEIKTSSRMGFLKGKPLYLDAQATTPLVSTLLCNTFKTYFLIIDINYKLLQDPRVLDAMMPYMTHSFGNPHSRTHMYGWESEEAVETARQVIKII